jgi:hypothetical protein
MKTIEHHQIVIAGNARRHHDKGACSPSIEQ